jgi:hypothetical protein
MRTLLHSLTAAAALGAALPVAAQTATHVYHLDGSLADAKGGPSLVGLGGTTGPSGYTFAANKGLTLANAIDPHVYSLELAFSFDDVSGFRKVLDFQGRSSDHGLYVNHGALTFFGVSVPRGPEVFQPGQAAHLVLTRDASKQFTAYVNGIARFSFTDTFDRAVFSAPGSLVSLFVDDLARGNASEASGGAADYLRVYDVALTGEQVTVRYRNGDTDPPPPVTTAPEPATVTLLATGVLALAVGARRRRAPVG